MNNEWHLYQRSTKVSKQETHQHIEQSSNFWMQRNLTQQVTHQRNVTQIYPTETHLMASDRLGSLEARLAALEAQWNSAPGA